MVMQDLIPMEVLASGVPKVGGFLFVKNEGKKECVNAVDVKVSPIFYN